MRRLHAISALAAAGGLAVAALVSAAPEDGALQVGVPPRVQCVGLVCGGNGGPTPRTWSYWVIPGSDGVNRVDIGVHYPMAWITQQVMPPGWSVQLLKTPTGDDLQFTPHGQLTPQEGACQYVLRWSGPVLYAPFQLGHSAGQGRHDTEWDTGGATLFVNGVANWSQRVGGGLGPVHSARFGPVPVEDGGEEPPEGALVLWPAEDLAHEHDHAR